MNKKFSTLLTGALLVGSVAANAVVTGINVDVATKIEQLTSGSRYYVLNTGTKITAPGAATNVLSMANGKVSSDQSDNTAFNKELWSIKVNAVAGANRFVFTNKAEGMTLSFDPANAIDVSTAALAADGSAEAVKKASQLTDVETEWSWVTTKDAGTELAELKGLAAYFHKDSVMKLYQVAGTVFAVKYANTATPKITNATEVEVQAVKPASITLKENDLNVLTDAKGKYFSLTSNKANLIGDVIKGVKFHATDVAATGYVVLNQLDTEKYLRVDTAVHAATGGNENNLYQLAVKELKEGETAANLAPNHFKIEKDLFTDSVFVSIKKVATRFTYSEQASVSGSHWATAMDVTSSGHAAAGFCTLSSILLTPSTEVMTFYNPETPTTATLVKENLLFAISEPAASSTAVSVNDGLYYIKNKAGQFLAAPIYNTTTGVASEAKWVTVNGGLQEVAHMPAYQWVVLKDKIYSETAKKTSTVTITNREFTATEASAVQLNQKDEASCLYVGAAFLDVKTTDSLKFVQIEDLAILSDTLLGYKNFEADSLLVNRYTFNYLHDYADSKYIVKSAKDSLAQATDGTQPFVIEAEEDIYDYGYEVTPAIAERIAGLKQLRRQAYQVYLPTAKGKLYLSKNAENKYMFTVPTYGTPSTFLFKEENDLTNNKHYHALVAVEQDEDWGTLASESYTKVGVIDASAILEDQKMSEQRTSAFNIGKYDAPLYRRFNSMKLEGNEGDAADTLRFVEKYRKEYLQVEANENFKVKGIDFLGIYTPDFTKDGKSFIVDTAFVNRWSGNIKPQYLISIDRDDVAGKDAEPCPLEHNHGYDKDGKPLDKWSCSHATAATPGFHYGKYLVNFADSVDHAAVKSADYGWKGYTRAGFVKAVHMGDSLYILTGQFADVTPATFDADAIHKAIKDKKYAAEYVKDLQGDAHKLVTWSMRFVDPENAANEAEEDRAFLMESQKAVGESRDIAPVSGQWLKMQNGCIVLSGTAGAESSFDQITGEDDALIFNIEKGNKDDMATDNEQIATSEVTVIAQQGAVRIANAEGKKVVITNILGQTIANTVITSSDAVIAAPAGVVVVAIEGEEAVKAIVK